MSLPIAVAVDLKGSIAKALITMPEYEAMTGWQRNHTIDAVTIITVAAMEALVDDPAMAKELVVQYVEQRNKPLSEEKISINVEAIFNDESTVVG